MPEDPRRRNKERNSDTADRVFSSEESNGSVSEIGGRWPEAFGPSHFLLVRRIAFYSRCFDDGVRADLDVALDSSERADLEDRAETRGVPVKPNDVANRTGPVDRGDPLADLAER